MVHTEQRPHWRIGDVLDRTDLAGLLDEVTRGVGGGRKWHCPIADHEDQHASVTMFRDRHGHERWRCWSGDHRGDAIDLVVAVRHCDRAEAIYWLATRAGMAPERPLPPIPVRRTPPVLAAVEPSPAIEHYVRLCESVLRGPQGRDVREWLHARGLADDTIQANRIGADPGRTLLRRDRGLPYGADAAAVLPALDPTGHIVYVQARYLDPETTGRKYDNPSSSLAPHPRLAYPAPTGQRGEVLLVCEGLPDALIASQVGYRTVALLGAQTPDWSVATRLAEFAAEHGLDMAIAADADPAGHRLTTTLTGLLGERGIDAISVTPPEGLDLNAWALVDPNWHDWIDQSIRPTSTIELADELEIDCIDL